MRKSPGGHVVRQSEKGTQRVVTHIERVIIIPLSHPLPLKSLSSTGRIYHDRHETPATMRRVRYSFDLERTAELKSWTIWTAKCPECGGLMEAKTSKAKVSADSSRITGLKSGQVNVPVSCLCGKKYIVRVCQAPVDVVLLEVK